MRFVLDTNIIIKYTKGNANVVRHIYNALASNETLIVPRVVDFEMVRGFEKNPAPRRAQIYQELLDRCILAEMDSRIWKRAVQVYAGLSKKHFTQADADTFISATCLEYGGVLVTNNTKDFIYVDGLELVDWS